MPVIIPEANIRGGKRRGRVYVDAEDLVLFLYKAAAEEGQDPGAALAMRMLAEDISQGFYS